MAEDAFDDKRKHQNSPEVANFTRTLSEEELTAYNTIKGGGARDRKRQFREMIQEQRLTHCKTKQEHVSTAANSDQVIGTFRNYWVIAEKEGGLMNKEYGMQCATNICTGCEARGVPFVMWDGAAKCKKYMHCEVGQSDIQTRTRSSIMQADVDIDEETVRLAMQQAKAEGLSAAPPGEETSVATAAVHVKKELIEPMSAAAAGDSSLPKVESEVNLLEVAKTLLAKNRGSEASGSSNSLVNALMLQQIMQAQKGDEEPAKPKHQKVTKVKTEPEKLWAECYAFGRKLDGMVTHFRSIVQQSADPNSDWHWANSQVGNTKSQIELVEPIVTKWSTDVRTSSLSNLSKKQGASTEKWLGDHKVEMQTAIDKIELPLGILVGMHTTMLKKTLYEKKPKNK